MNRFIPEYVKIFLLILSLTIVSVGEANNIVISNVNLTGQNTTDNFTFIKFDISWENSWRTSAVPNNWDAAWIFVKYRIGAGNWMHATLQASGHIAPDGSTISAPADNTGVFLYRSADGSGTFSKSGVKLRWDYGIDGVGNNDVVDVKVFAIEMVYVPGGSFYAGSGGTEVAHFYTYPDVAAPYFVSGEDEIIVGTSVGNLYYSSINVDQGDQLGPVPAAFPKGTTALYCMKYEITQQCYVDFLNMLTRTQQDGRTETNLAVGVTSVTNRYVLCNTSAMIDRNGVRCDATIDANAPISFYCDFNGNGVGGEADDGQDIACNYVSWADLVAYFDWTALRPMSEFEYEKICRGRSFPVPNDRPWGTTTDAQIPGVANAGSNNETTTGGGNVNYTGILGGPIRVGATATGTSSRYDAGACYYGAMDMGGNVWERPVSCGHPVGRAFTGLNGNGSLNTAGDADVANWPGANAAGAGFRGGWWNIVFNSYLRISGRNYTSHVGYLRIERMGGRGIRGVN